MLKRILGGPLVELVERDDPRLVVRGRRPFPVGDPVALRVRGSKGGQVRIKLLVEGNRELPDGGVLCHGVVEDPIQLATLDQLRGSAVILDGAVRRAVRYSCNLAVTVERQTGTIIDFSTGGVQLESELELLEGQMVQVPLNANLGCQARVAWTRASRAGLEFTAVQAADRELLRRFERQIRDGYAGIVARATAQAGPKVIPQAPSYGEV